MLVSIVLPAYDEEETIEDCLKSLIHQSYEPKEIIVINDGSTDNTRGIADRLAKGSPSVTLVDIEHSGRSYARNEGLKLSKGELIFFAEADAIYHPDYLTRAIEGFKDERVGGVLLEGEVWSVDSFISKCMQAEVELRNADLRSGRSLPKSAWVYRIDVLTKLGGFDESLEAGEDSDLGNRLRVAGYIIKWVEGVSWWFKNPETLQELLARHYWFGREEATGLYKKYPKEYPWIKTLLVALFGISILAAVFYHGIILWIFGWIIMSLLLKIGSILKRGKGVIETKYAVTLGVLSPIRFVAFLTGNLIGLLSSAWIIFSPNK